MNKRFYVFEWCLKFAWYIEHHLSMSIIIQMAVIMFLYTGLNWQRNIGRRFTVLRVHPAVVLSVEARSTTVWLINVIPGALSASQKTNHYQERLTSENVGRSLFFRQKIWRNHNYYLLLHQKYASRVA